MATTKASSNQPGQKSKLLKVAETVGTIAGTVVGKKNQLVKKAEKVIATAKEKVHELTAKKAKAKKTVKKAVKKAAKKAVTKAAKKTAEVKKVAKKAARTAQARTEKNNG